MLSTRVSLLERLRTPDDEAAWVRFVELYTPLMLRWALRQGLQPTDAADAVQDVMAVLVEKFDGFRYDSGRSFRAWLRTVVVNKVRERARRKTAHTLPEPAVLDELPARAADEDDDEDRKLLVRRGLELIRGEFAESVWKAFWEYAVAGRPVGEVAAELGISPGTVYAAKSRVLTRLRLEIDSPPE